MHHVRRPSNGKREREKEKQRKKRGHDDELAKSQDNNALKEKRGEEKEMFSLLARDQRQSFLRRLFTFSEEMHLHLGTQMSKYFPPD